MSASTFHIRTQLLDIARMDVGKREVTKNQAPWIAKLWTATNYPDGMENREPYCASGLAYCVMRWLEREEVRNAFGFTKEQAEHWRCQSPRVFDWVRWAKDRGLQTLPPFCILHSADIAVYTYSHIELVSNDDGTDDGPFTAIGYNSADSASVDARVREGEGCVEKPRTRNKVQCFLRLLP